MKTVQDIAAYRPMIHKIVAFRYMSEAELEQFVNLCEVVDCRKGETIIHQGDAGEHLYGIIDGRVTIAIKELQKEPVVVGERHAGDFIGETAIVKPSKRTASVTCATRSVILRIHHHAIFKFLNTMPRAGNKFLLVLVMRLLQRLEETSIELAYARQSDIDWDAVDSMVDEFMTSIENSSEPSPDELTKIAGRAGKRNPTALPAQGPATLRPPARPEFDPQEP